MKILAINSSFRGKKGYTQFLIDRLFEGATAAGADCETVVLAEKEIRRCTGCFLCQRKDRLYKCIHDGNDDARNVFDKMREADLIIFATPVYVFGMSSLLKNLLDRYPATADCSELRITKSGLFFHRIDESLCAKPFATIVSHDNVEWATHENIVSYFMTYAKFMDAKYVGSLVRSSAMAAGHGWDGAALVKFPVLKDIYAAFQVAGAELVLRGRIRSKTQHRANRAIVRIPLTVRLLAHIPGMQEKITQKIRTRMEI